MRTLRSIPVLLLLAMTVTGRAAAPSLLYSFTGSADGAYPHASLAAATDGTLYGATSNGGYAPGTLGGGTIFKVTAAGALTTLYTFPNTGTNGSGPNSLLIGADGNLHGTTVNGGTNARGTVIQLAVGIPSGTPTPTPTPTGTPTPTLTATPTPTPTPSSAIPTVDIHAGGSGVFSKAGGKGKLVFIRSGGDTSTALTVYYKVKGSAANGTEYTGPGGVALSGSVVIPAGETTLKLKLKALVVPDQREKVKVILKADPAGLYQLGTGTAATLFMG